MKDFRSLSPFSGHRLSCYILIILLLVSINSYAISSAADATAEDVSNSDDLSDEDQSSSADDGTASSDEDSDNNSDDLSDSSESASNSTQSIQESASDEEQTSTVSEQEGQQDSNATSSVSDSEDTNQTSFATTDDAEQGQSTTGYNQTGNSSSNSTEAAGESGQDGYQNINSTYTVPDSTYLQESNGTVDSGNNTNPDSGSGITPSTNNSTNYNGTQTEANVTSENNSNANMTDTANNNSTSEAQSQNATALTAPGPVPDFTVSIDPLIMSVNAGSSASYSIVVTSVNGFSSNVSLAITFPPISGMTTSLGSNITRPPVNASATSLLTIQSDSTAHGGKYKLKVTGSAANVTGTRSASVTLEVIGQNVTVAASDTLGLDAVALTPILIKNIEGNGIFTDRGLSTEKMVFISTTVVNNYNRTQPFILVMEIRDKSHQTLFIQLLRGVLSPDGQLEFDISWMPGKADTYEIRSFVIDHLPDPGPMSAVIGRTYAVS